MNQSEAESVVLHCTGAVAQITLNRPRAGNCLSIDLVEALQACLDTLREREDIKVIVIDGAGGKIFSAGHDLNEFVGAPDRSFLERDFAGISRLMQTILGQPQIVIAKIAGVATAAGCELVAACDLAIASSDARFGLPGVNIGFWCHIPQVLVSRQVGRKAAMMMLATGDLFSAEHALRIGLINDVVASGDLDQAVLRLTSQIAQKPASVLRAGKASFLLQSDRAVPHAYDCARNAALKNIESADAKEGVAAFLAKRPVRWQS